MNKTKIIILGLCLLVLVGCSSEAVSGTETTSPTLVSESVPKTETPLPTPVSEVALNTETPSPVLPMVLVIRNGTIIVGTGAAPIPNGVVVIKDGLIIAVGAEGEIEIPEDATILDAGGGTILPGLIDAHVHAVNGLFVAEGDISATRILGNLSRGLKAGITTFVDTGSPWGMTRDVIDLREALNHIGNQAPNAVISGPILAAPDSPVFSFAPSATFIVENSEDARAVTKNLINQGVDFIKIYVGTISRTSPDGRTHVPSLSGEQIQAITQAAHEEGVLVFAHAVDEDAAFLAIANGVDAFVHWPGKKFPLPDGLLQQLIDEEITVITTFNFFLPYPDDIRLFLDAGGTLVMGTDANNVSDLANKPFTEMDFMIEAGMTPMEVIIASTANGADLLGLGDLIGTLEVGKLADIIVVNGDPLADFSIIKDVIIVIKGGEVIVSPVE